MGALPWTRLEDTDLWVEAQATYAQPAGRTYHSFDHVRRLYEHAARTFCLPYDPALDLAVLAHDALIDGPRAERRSAAWLRSREGLVREAWSRIHNGTESIEDVMTRAGHLILATERHRPTPSTAPMVLLDLADFLDADVSRINSALLRTEAAALRGWDDNTWAEQTRSYLSKLSASLALGLISPPRGSAATALTPALQDQIRAIRFGIDRVVGEVS